MALIMPDDTVCKVCGEQVWSEEIPSFCIVEWVPGEGNVLRAGYCYPCGNQLMKTQVNTFGAHNE